ncbi:ABC transporter ATP-binding protein [Edwardsiella tarda]|uniref:ABC transporter ATP-binding protein n=1 Tax=Edwardsiella tarda TaxID=636 RepID=UPI00351C1DC3
MTLLALEQATLGYHRRPLLREVSFSLPAGSLCCLLGANGSGKTTLMRSLLGILPLLKGRVRLDGIPLQRLSHRERARLIAWVPQAHEGAFAFRVLDMVMMGITPHLPPSPCPARANAHRRWPSSTPWGSSTSPNAAGANSAVESANWCSSRALAQRPRLLLMDEPASSLDFGHQINLLDTLSRLRRDGMTLLMATHHPLHARALADSVVRIEPDGRVTQGDPASQLSSERLAALYRVSVEQIHHHLGYPRESST